MTIETGSTNIYADLDMPAAEEMLIKAQLAAKIGEIIKHRRLTQAKAADIMGLPQPKSLPCYVANSVGSVKPRC